MSNADDPDETYFFDGFHKYAYISSTPVKWATTISWRYNPAGRPPHFSDVDVLSTLQAATAKWEAACNVKFEYAGTTSTAPDSSCDGKTVVGWAPLSGSTVGWAWACWSGTTINQADIKLDNQEPYQITSLGLLGKVAVHEFGHALGLGHTSVSPAVMTSTLSTSALVQDDIDGCVSLYGPPASASPPVASVGPTSLSFGDVTVGSSSAAKTIQVTNSGAGSLTIESLDVGGANPGDFNRSGTCSPGSSLGEGQSCTISVTFTPLASGSRSASLSVATSAGTKSAALSGTGVAPVSTLAPAASVSASSLSFGSVTVGTSSSVQTVALTNTGSATLTIAGVSLQGANAGDFQRGGTCNAGVSLAVGASCTISISFAPTAEGTRVASIAVASDGGNPSIALSGSGVFVAQPSVPNLSFSATSIDFSDQTVGTTSRKRSISITNGGTQSVLLQQVALAGLHPQDFAMSGSCGSGITLAPGSTCNVRVTFTPSAAGGRSATINVVPAGATVSDVVALSGNGVDASSTSTSDSGGGKPPRGQGKYKATLATAVEYYNQELNHYFVTVSEKEIDALDLGQFRGWKRTGAEFDAAVEVEVGLGGSSATLTPGAVVPPLAPEGPALVPVCRFYGNPAFGLDSHFYTAFPAECEEIQRKFPDAWLLESAAVMHVYLPDPVSGACPADSAPLYRLWNQSVDVNHRYTSDLIVRARMISLGWAPEGAGPLGVGMCVPADE